VTCRDIDELMSIAPRNRMLAPEAFEHLCECGNCRALVSALWESLERTSLTVTNLGRIEARIVENLKPVRPLAPARLFLFACAIIFLCAVAVGAAPFRMNGWGALSLVQRAGVFATVTASAVMLAVSMVGQMVPGDRYAFAPAALPIMILAVLPIVLGAEFQPRAETTFVANGFVCIKNGLTYSIPAMFLFLLLVRRGAMLDPTIIGATVGALAGLTGLTVLEINCSNLNLFHILVWHWGMVLISTAAGALLGAALEYIERRRWQLFLS
jgi:hypothetical protein